MHRIDGPGATGDHKFTDGDPIGGVPATVVTDDFLNAVQEEVSAVVEGVGLGLSKPDNTQLRQAIAKMIAAATPAGAVQAFATAAVPSGWLECNGAAISRTTYVALFAAIGTVFGAGDGATTFALPDLRGEFVRGWDHARGIDAGRGFGSFEADAFKAHTHSYAVSHAYTPGGAEGGARDAVGESTEATGSTGGAETRPRNVALMYCIKT